MRVDGCHTRCDMQKRVVCLPFFGSEKRLLRHARQLRDDHTFRQRPHNTGKTPCRLCEREVHFCGCIIQDSRVSLHVEKVYSKQRENKDK